jgi:UDP-4-amino-4,6-dideoxy-N-acetyl-beta-L-altrosamine transaminase
MPYNIPYGRQHISPDDITAVINTLQADFLTQGPAVDAFEQAFAQYIGCRYAVAVANGTAALHLAALALNFGAGKRVITTPITFAASANCVLYGGGSISFADIDRQTYLIDLNYVEDLLRQSHYDGIIPVDFGGYPVDTEALQYLSNRYGCAILEDACHAPGAWFTDTKGTKQHCGNGVYADAAIFSFHPVKHIACGEGGMITTNSQAIYEKLLMLRTHGITKNPAMMQQNNEGGWYYEMQVLGFNYRMPDILCALGSSQLQRAEAGLQRRQAIADRYRAELSQLPLSIQAAPKPQQQHAYHLFIVETENRKAFYDHLRQHQIFAQVHYIPVHTLPYYQSLGFKRGQFPQAEDYYAHCLSLPMYPSLSHDEQSYVIDVIKQYFATT